jgi:hypothetical protein
MDTEIRDKERKLEHLKVDNEIEKEKVDIAQKKALEAEAREKYGSNWKKVLGWAKGLKPDQEKVSDLYSMGVGGEELRSLNDPRKFGVKK